MFDFVPNCKKIFFSGICGISMYSLAIAAKSNGFDVIGSDIAPNSEISVELEKNGIKVIPFHSAENVMCDVFVYTSAVSEDNAELKKAREIGAKIFTRAEFLGNMISEYQNRIGIAGTHGKSTVSGMCHKIFSDCGLDHSAFIGARDASGSSFRLGKGDTVLFEACEYKRSFLNFTPTVGAVLNIERDHTDCYPSFNSQISAFQKYVDRSRIAVLSSDDPIARGLKHDSGFYFSLHNMDAELHADGLYSHYGQFSYIGVLRGKREFEVNLKVSGLHNVRNSLAAMSIAVLQGLDLEAASRSVSEFSGMRRRFEFLGEMNGAAVYDDYAHHPTEIRAALSAAKAMGFDKIYCAFQSHTFSRTAALFNEFASSFYDADRVFITDIYAAREEDNGKMSGELLAAATPNAEYVPISCLAERLAGVARKGVMIITMGAGRLDEIAKTVVNE